MGGGIVEVVSSRGCSRLFVAQPFGSSVKNLKPFGSMSPASSSAVSESVKSQSRGSFTGLVICVTGLSKEARKQVREATERLGGQYSPNLHPQCTHLVVQSLGGRKFDHALKHGSRTGLLVVTFGWFVDSVRRNVRMSESLYSTKTLEENGPRLNELNKPIGFTGTEKSCLPYGTHGEKQFEIIGESRLVSSGRESNRSNESTLAGLSMYIDDDISPELRNKVVEAATREGASFAEQWFVGCSISHVVCEGSSTQKYLGHSTNIVTPLWVLKTAKEKHVQRLVHLSADLARQISTLLEYFQNGITDEVTNEENGAKDAHYYKSKTSQTAREQIVSSAKIGVRNRRSHRMQTCQTPVRPITPSSLLDSISWSISEPTSSASIYTDSFSGEDISDHPPSIFFDANVDGKESDASFSNLTRTLTESEKSECILKNHFLTVLFPLDRFAEMGPSSRTFFSKNGFTCLQVLDYIYAFYQENMSVHEIEAAIHTDSKHADRLRSVYCSKETTEHGYVTFKRVDFLGSRRSFEMLKRVNGDNNSNVYELLIRA